MLSRDLALLIMALMLIASVLVVGSMAGVQIISAIENHSVQLDINSF